jgi:hypothetical protein
MAKADIYDLPNGDVIFKQRHLLRRHQYRLGQDGVYVAENWLTGSTSYKIPFENIPKDHSEITVSSAGYFWFGLVLAALSITTALMLAFHSGVEPVTPILWAVLAILTGFLYLISRQRFLVFRAPAGLESLILFRDKPSRELLENFLARVHTRKNEYLRRTYLREDGLPLADAVRTLEWLKEQGVVTNEEFEHFKAKNLGAGPWGSSPPSPN